ncbi:uncharacterized protein LOC119720161 [Patiria miniata]|uniref:Uncharacterized protein n=1 Tax=Patiria miniata TaxID=46514 RepID=A0A913Z175_PATMI|nr:uncharacterized protein LOC119720161 [Patiria miniata]
MESPIINRRLRRSNSLTESVNPEGRLSSPVFYMRNSRKKRNKDSNEQRETEEAPEESTSPVETLKFDDDCVVNLQRPIRNSQRKRMVSSPDYQSDLHQHAASFLGPDNQPSSLPSQQHPDGQTHDSEPMTKESDRKNESKYVTMFPRKLGDLEGARGWSNVSSSWKPN